MSGCAMRVPCFTVASNSVDRVMRLRAGSTAKDLTCDQAESARRPCGADRTRSRARRACASATGSHARGLGAGYSAGRSACPWPRRSPRCLPSGRSDGSLRARLRFDRRVVLLLLAGAVPKWCWVAAVSPTFGRLFEGNDQPSPGQTWPAATQPRPAGTEISHSAPASHSGQLTYRAEASPSHPKRPDWSTAERLAAARKTVSFCQVVLDYEQRSTTKRGW